MESTIERELHDNQAGFRKTEGTQNHIAKHEMDNGETIGI